MSARTESRQQPGFACEECRKKKLRCDRQRPQCGACTNAGVICQVNDRRLPRPRKTGTVEALRGRIKELESHLATLQSSPSTAVAGHDPLLDLEDLECIAPIIISNSQKSPADNYAGTADVEITDLMKADLTQIYFERAHPVAPMLNQSRFMKLAQKPQSHERQCLQYAMWTLSITFSSQFGNIRDSMYSKTRAMLEDLNCNGSNMTTCHVEEIQARILLTLYELSKCTYRQAWLSSGHVFRLVQLARFYELDKEQSKKGKRSSAEAMQHEEKRRTFWVAFCLDRFLSIGNNTPVTFTEQRILTRLPCSDYEFSNGSLTEWPFLFEVMATGNARGFAPLADCSILMTICERALDCKNDASSEASYDDLPMELKFQNDWLNSLLTTRLNSIELHYRAAPRAGDPMTIFIHLMARTANMHVSQAMGDSLSLETTDSSMSSFPSWNMQDRSVWAAQEIPRLAQELEHLGHFRAHTFTALPIYLSAIRLGRYVGRQKVLELSPLQTATLHEVESSLRACLEALRKLQAMNMLAAYYLQLFQMENSGLCD
ncbi:hypothetical protein M406DRAFT_37614 [Cryphonectria parasitica EP155]|uniref:Zn(2)-C6 fungal-type domain-containing protein n=1 Tax=Cryphonectria parasitica (strain ATCC 38755 / EP155) TaxID=660469 RepID=A0A9P4Y512_CRYP1|nr:uncharacterized protein M406DRAFT_37614 [Cryphonectria parasitica EP155]KAF3766615.1 hypothetical protein M406DRAFT_37614 [Cryphonectria parasitica EP155]